MARTYPVACGGCASATLINTLNIVHIGKTAAIKGMSMTELAKNTSEDLSTLRKKTSFGSDVLTLVSGTTFAQILTILATPILTRLYGPEDFGLLALFLSITGILGTIVCLRY